MKFVNLSVLRGFKYEGLKSLSVCLTWIQVWGLKLCESVCPICIPIWWGVKMKCRLSVYLSYFDSNMRDEMKSSLSVCLSCVYSNFRDEVKRSLSVCLSCVDSNFRTELNVGCLSCVDSNLRGEMKRGLSVCLAKVLILEVKWNVVCPSFYLIWIPIWGVKKRSLSILSCVDSNLRGDLKRSLSVRLTWILI